MGDALKEWAELVWFERAPDGSIAAVYEVVRARYASPEAAAAVVEEARRRGVLVRGEVERG